MKSVQKSGALPLAQTCPTEERSKNLAYFLEALLCWTHLCNNSYGRGTCQSYRCFYGLKKPKKFAVYGSTELTLTDDSTHPLILYIPVSDDILLPNSIF